MEFELNTHELQLAVISFIDGKYSHSVTRDDPQTMDKLIHLFAEINRNTDPAKDFTVKFTVEW